MLMHMRIPAGANTNHDTNCTKNEDPDMRGKHADASEATNRPLAPARPARNSRWLRRGASYFALWPHPADWLNTDHELVSSP